MTFAPGRVDNVPICSFSTLTLQTLILFDLTASGSMSSMHLEESRQSKPNESKRFPAFSDLRGRLSERAQVAEAKSDWG